MIRVPDPVQPFAYIIGMCLYVCNFLFLYIGVESTVIMVLFQESTDASRSEDSDHHTDISGDLLSESFL